MNEFFNLAAKIAYDNRVAAKQASDTWNKIKAAASKAGAKAKEIAGNKHFQKGAASAAAGTTAGVAGKMLGMSGKGAFGLGAGVAAGTEAGLEGGPALVKAIKDRIKSKKAKTDPTLGLRKVEGTNLVTHKDYFAPEEKKEEKPGPFKENLK